MLSSSTSKLHIAWAGTWFFVSIGLAPLAVASCATSDHDAASPQEDAATLLDGGPLDRGSDTDGSADAGCGDASCEILSCDEADFCAIPTNVDARYALTSIWGSAANDVWAVGSAGTVIHWDGATWTNVPSGRPETLRSIWGSSAQDIWIVSTPSVILRSNGFKNGTATFTLAGPIPEISDGTLLNAVWGPGADAVFVAGERTGWYPLDSMWRHVEGVASGDDSAAEWEVASTYCREDPCFEVNAMWGTSASDLWVVGAGGGLRRSKGAVGNGGSEQWMNVKTTLTTASLNGIWGRSASDVWIVGDHGTIRHWTNDPTQRWQIVPSPTTENLRSVWGSGVNDVWAVGDAGTILHFDGTAWKTTTATLPSGPEPRLYGVWGSGPNDVWVVGEGIVLHFTGAKAKAASSADGDSR